LSQFLQFYYKSVLNITFFITGTARIVAQEAGAEGGGAFLLQWILFLCIWSIPLIIGEYAVGKNTRVGIAQSFKTLGGESHMYALTSHPNHLP
jgi:SNF family Na+-dependent transporter